MSLWGSAWDGHDRRPLRIGIVAIMALSQAVEAFQVGWQSQDTTRYPPTGALSRSLAELPGAAWVLLALIGLGLYGVARDRRPITSGVLALGVAAVLSEWQTQIFGSPSRNAFFPGAVLFGWVLGQVWAVNLRSGRAFRERLAEAGAIGCLAAAYVGSALSKVLSTGLAWADGAQVRALVLQQQPLAQWGPLLAVRSAIIESQDVAIAASVATLAIEGGAVLLLFGPRLRLTWGLLLIGLHASIAAINTMPYVGASLLLALLCLPWKRPAEAEDLPPRLPTQVAVLLLCTVIAAWASARWGWRASS